MITGYYYSDTVERNKEKQQIKKIVLLILEANLIYLFWKVILNRDDVMSYIRSIFTVRNLMQFLFLNVSPVAGHLWYLGAILYVLVIVFVMNRIGCRKALYYLTPVLLVVDLLVGKYSLLIFHREFPYILVRNFLCVGIPYFCIGNLIREKHCTEKWNKKVLQVLVVVFAITSLIERFVLVNTGLNATRDHYASTTFMAICFFVYALESNWKNKGLAAIGRKYSTWIYIIHLIFITIFQMVTDRVGGQLIYKCVAPIAVYCTTLIFLIALQKIKIGLKTK